LSWFLSIPLLLVGTLLAVGNGLAIVGLAVDALRGRSRATSFMLPCVGGVLLFGGVLLLPLDLPFNRLLSASLAACLDLSLLAVMVMFITLPFRKTR